MIKHIDTYEGLDSLPQVLEQAQVGIWQVDLTTQISQWNRFSAHLLGYDSAKTIYSLDDFYSRVHPADLNKVKETFQSAVEKRELFECEYRVIWPNGEIHWVYSRASVQYDTSGNPVSSGGVVLDIDKKKEAELSLKFREEGFRRLYESSLLGIAFGNEDGYVYEANDAYLNILGLTREEFQTAQPFDWKKITPIEHMFADKRALNQAIEKGACDVYEKEYIKKDGTRVSVLVGIALRSEFNQDGIVFVLDVSKQKNAENLLRQSHERYTNFISQSSEGIWRYELDEPMPVHLPIDEQVAFIFDHAYLAECNKKRRERQKAVAPHEKTRRGRKDRQGSRSRTSTRRHPITH